MEEEIKPFNPFSEDYDPRISNGELQALSAEIQSLKATLSGLEAQVNETVDAVRAEAQHTITAANHIIEGIDRKTETFILACQERIKKKLDEQIVEVRGSA